MTCTKTLALSMALLALNAAAFAADGARPTPTAATQNAEYSVNVIVSQAGQVVAEPSLELRAGHEAMVNQSGKNGYTLKITASELAGREVKLDMAFESATSKFGPVTLATKLGSTASVATGDMRIEVRVR
jgi:nitrous oxidase accessory protein NosD